MAAQAGRRPEVLILGAEPFLNVVASAVRHVDEQALDNIRLRQGDARQLMADLPDASLDRGLHPLPRSLAQDPPPQTAHHSGRDNRRAGLRVLKPGGGLRFATDWNEYADWTLERLTGSPLFDWTAQRADDCLARPAGGPYHHKV